jgi:hypothetical protein
MWRSEAIDSDHPDAAVGKGQADGGPHRPKSDDDHLGAVVGHA